MSQKGEDIDNENPKVDSDPLIDSLLEECLGGLTPPDLSSQIIARLRKAEKANEQTLVSTRRTTHARQYKSTRTNRFLTISVIVATLAVVTSVVGFVAWKHGNGFALTQNETAQVDDVSVVDEKPADTPTADEMAAEVADGAAVDPPDETVSSESIASQSASEPGTSEPESFVFFGESQYAKSIEPSSAEAIVNFVDDVFQKQWSTRQIEPASAWPENEWLERVYVRVLGRSPDPSELASFAKSKDPNKRPDLIRTLVESPEYSAEFVAHWTNVFQTRLLGDVASKPIIASAVEQDVPFPRLVQSLVKESQSGLVSICRNILGERLECAQCHDNQGQSAERYAQLATWLRPETRSQFSEAVARSDEAHQAFVNNIWQHFFGHRLTPWSRQSDSALQPVLDRLTQEFIAADHDPKKLIQWIAMTEVFSLSAEVTRSNETDSVVSGEPLFSRQYTQSWFATSVEESLAKVATSSFDLMGVDADPIETIASVAPDFKADVVPENDQPDFWSTIALMNRDAGRSRILVDHRDMLEHIALSKLSRREKAEHVILAVTGRRPTPKELSSAVEILRSQASNELLGLRDIWWAAAMGHH